jgi:hypothetical protein
MIGMYFSEFLTSIFFFKKNYLVPRQARGIFKPIKLKNKNKNKIVLFCFGAESGEGNGRLPIGVWAMDTRHEFMRVHGSGAICTSRNTPHGG